MLINTHTLARKITEMECMIFCFVTKNIIALYTKVSL